MKSIEKANTSATKKKKMTLQDYYNSLPEKSIVAPRKALIDRIAARCEVPASTVRSWLVYNIKPRDRYSIEILSEETGIAIEDMWESK